ncbi:hypothetical protein D3C78_1709540 [compost metagenome]
MGNVLDLGGVGRFVEVVLADVDRAEIGLRQLLTSGPGIASLLGELLPKLEVGAPLRAPEVLHEIHDVLRAVVFERIAVLGEVVLADPGVLNFSQFATVHLTSIG